MTTTEKKLSGKRGFGSLSPERRKEIASMGGKAIPAEKRAFSRDPGLAARSGKKGGRAVPAERRAFSCDRGLASRAGSKGGKAVRAKRAEPESQS